MRETRGTEAGRAPSRLRGVHACVRALVQGGRAVSPRPCCPARLSRSEVVSGLPHHPSLSHAGHGTGTAAEEMRGDLGRLQGATAWGPALGAQQPSYEGLLGSLRIQGTFTRCARRPWPSPSAHCQQRCSTEEPGGAPAGFTAQLCSCVTSLSLRRPIFKTRIIPVLTPQIAL